MGALLEELDCASGAADHDDVYLQKAEGLARGLEDAGLGDYSPERTATPPVFSRQMGRIAEARQWAAKELQLHRFAAEDSPAVRTTLAFLASLDSGPSC